MDGHGLVDAVGGAQPGGPTQPRATDGARPEASAAAAAARVADAQTSEAGLFFFFAPANLEVLVKVLDGCDVNGHHWVSAASATDMGLDLVVRDLRSGAKRRYVKAAGEPEAFTDTSAFRSACVGEAS
ncbi:MAG: hypothetical protein F4210_03685 [Holophagales bacterium]|nr:hypothetical protein [Holophagales bacterium]MYF94609.1 hypothetical protein [Holophagales bacterium]